MEDVIQLYRNLRDKIIQIQDDIDTNFGIAQGDVPSSALSAIFNKATLAVEILSGYDADWKKIRQSTQAEIERKKRENRERVIEIQKMIFVLSMSIFEHNAKVYHQQNPKKLGKINTRSGRVYLWNIMDKSKDKKIIFKKDFNLWDGLIKLRNSLVHNNAISEINKTCNYPKCKLTLKKDKMLKGNLKLFPKLMDWMIDAIANWIKNIETQK